MVIKEDLKPEFVHYKDEGCELAPSCLECPFNNCLQEIYGGKRIYKLGLRNKKIKELFDNDMKIKDIAQEFHLSIRTVYRVIYAWP